MARANIRQIEAFNAVMQAGSVTQAAEALFVSQPAVTKLVQAFEKSCGFKLFQRSQGRLVPTPEARRLFAETHTFMTGVGRIENTALAIKNSQQGDLTAVAFPALSMRLMPWCAARYLSDKPDVRFSVLTRNSIDVPNSMISHAADFGLSLLPTRESTIVCQPFRRIMMVCALPSGHPLTESAQISPQQLENEEIVCLGRDDQSRMVVEEAFARYGIKIGGRYEVQMADAACMLVAEGAGIAIVPSIASVGWERHEGIVFRPLSVRVSMDVWLYTPTWDQPPTLAKMFLHEIDTGISQVEEKLIRDPADSYFFSAVGLA
ncbi:LysR substrate-binding domain-containing protein [Breoghania sp.]|uniref:LysR substrate-binding domain-containing protein n=1 Tax=Breoghania sp. TaxID=2065378 RepID=UPI002AA7F9D9|nr:LysR substrate-binding domain-containing protein [Breoghania sp.]